MKNSIYVPSAEKQEIAGLLFGAAAILAWSTSASCVVWIGRQVGVWQYLAVSSLLGCFGQAIFYRLNGRKIKDIFILPAHLLMLSILGFVIYSVCYVMGLVKATSDAQAVGVGLMNYLWPILTVLFSLFLTPGSRMSPRLGVALALSFSGLIIANWQGILNAGSNIAALPYFLGGMAGISWALYSALVARWKELGRRFATAPLGFFAAGLVGLAVSLIKGEWQPGDAKIWTAFLYLGLVPNAAGYMFWEMALHRAPAAKVGILASAAPVLSTLCLFSLFYLTGESRALPDRWGHLLTGACLIAAAIILVSARSALGRMSKLRLIKKRTSNNKKI